MLPLPAVRALNVGSSISGGPPAFGCILQIPGRDFLRKGKLVKAADGTPIRIDALAADGSEGDDTAEVEILPPRLILDSRRGVDLDLDDDQLLEIPPLLVFRAIARRSLKAWGCSGRTRNRSDSSRV